MPIPITNSLASSKQVKYIVGMTEDLLDALEDMTHFWGRILHRKIRGAEEITKEEAKILIPKLRMLVDEARRLDEEEDMDTSLNPYRYDLE